MRTTDLRVLACVIAMTLAGCSPAGDDPHAAHGTPAAAAAASPGSPAAAGDVVIADAWSRATPPMSTIGAAYLSITNHRDGVARLLGASTPVAGRIELHETRLDEGVMRMRPVEALEIATHATTTLAPGGLHFMLIDLATPLVAGSRFPLTLEFEPGGPVTVDVEVRGDTAAQDHAH